MRQDVMAIAHVRVLSLLVRSARPASDSSRPARQWATKCSMSSQEVSARACQLFGELGQGATDRLRWHALERVSGHGFPLSVSVVHGERSVPPRLSARPRSQLRVSPAATAVA